MRRTCPAALAALLSLLAIGSSADASATPDPAAIEAVTRYVIALEKPDAAAAYRVLTPAQQRYFGNARNFASNYATTHYRIEKFTIARVTMREPDLAQVDVTETTSFFDIAAERTAIATATEPYFAIKTAGVWGVKEIYVPWKSYAPKATGSAGDLTAIVDRVEFFDRRVRVYCTLRDLGDVAVQVLPLLHSRLTLGGKTVAALDTADFPLNDEQLFEGARIYPLHQVVGYINFPLSSRADVDQRVTLVISPIVPDGASRPLAVTIGPFELAKW